MITAESLLACTDTATLADLLQTIGYPASPVPILAEEWRRLGIEIGFSEGARFSHICRLPSVHLFALESLAVEREACLKFINSYDAINCIVKPIIFNIFDSGTSLVVFAAGKGRRLRAREVSLTTPKWHDADLFNVIELAGEEEVAEALFNRALDRTTLGREFFRRFRDAWLSIRRELAVQFPDEPDEEIAPQALLILSRILFLYFIQEKGWLDRNRRFLSNQFHDAVARGEEFFSSRLIPLFFGCLNRPVSQRDRSAAALGTIPYLNGGLFDRSPFERRKPETHLSNRVLETVIEELFEKFSFSTEEGEEEDAHIDPEMLGRVFESLMAGEERLASGSFYTPKEIVDRLTREALAAWLSNGGSEVPLEALESGELPADVTSEVAARLLDRLSTVTVIDPACGSGAFLLAAVRQIESLTRRLAARAGAEVGERLRQRIVERAIHGVDLKPEAVRLCELRLWLAIVSETDVSSDQVPPLPNLDRNILQGNTLLGALDFLGEGRGAIYRDWSYALRSRADVLEHYKSCSADAKPHLARALRESDISLAEALVQKAIDEDRRELECGDGQNVLPFASQGNRLTVRKRRAELLDRLSELERELRALQRGELGFFAFEVHYSQIMAEGGFDVVVGNPPWVRASRIPQTMRRMLTDRYEFFRSDRRGFSQPDLALAFFERSLAIAKSGGIVSLLLPGKIATAAYASRLRRTLVADTELLSIGDWSDRSRELFDADTFPMSVSLRKVKPRSGQVSVSSDGTAWKTPRISLPLNGEGSPWLLAPPAVREVIDRIRLRHAPLSEVLGRCPLMGVKTGDNRSFMFDELELTARGTLYSPSLDLEIPRTAVCRTVRGRDVRAWKATASTWMLWPPQAGWSAGLEWARKLAKALGVELDVLRLSWLRAEHLGMKVVWKDVSRLLQAAVLPQSVEIGGHEFPLIPNQTLYSIDACSLEEARTISALLNSTVARALALVTAERAKDNHFRFFGSLIAGLPFPSISQNGSDWRELVRLARQAEAGAEVSERLNLIVARVYGLDAGEMTILSGFLDRKTQPGTTETTR